MLLMRPNDSEPYKNKREVFGDGREQIDNYHKS